MNISFPLIQQYYDFRSMSMPSGRNAANFLLTELGELMDAYIRSHQSGWTRNNPDKSHNLIHELGDSFQMLFIANYQFHASELQPLSPADFYRISIFNIPQAIIQAAAGIINIPFDTHQSTGILRNLHQIAAAYQTTPQQALLGKWTSKGFSPST